MRNERDFITLCYAIKSDHHLIKSWCGGDLSGAWFTRSGLADIIGYSIETAKNRIKSWKQQGLILEFFDEGHGRFGVYEYCLSQEGIDKAEKMLKGEVL